MEMRQNRALYGEDGDPPSEAAAAAAAAVAAAETTEQKSHGPQVLHFTQTTMRFTPKPMDFMLNMVYFRRCC